MMIHDFNKHPEDNPNKGRAAWQFAPRKMHTAEYPLNVHCDFYPKFVPKSQNAWLKGEDPVTCETVYDLKPVYAYPETCVFIKQTEGDNGQWQVWVTSLDGEYRWVSPKAYTSLSYAKRQAMQFRYLWECLVVAVADIPDTQYVKGERVQCCNGSAYPAHQLGYCMGTVVNPNVSAAYVTVELDSHVKTRDNIFDMRVDHVYSLAPVRFSVLAVGAAHPDFVASKMNYLKIDDSAARKASPVMEGVTGAAVADWIHDQRTAYPPRDFSTWHIKGFDRDNMLISNHSADLWVKEFVQFMHPVGSNRRVVAGNPNSPMLVKVISAKQGLVKCRLLTDKRVDVVLTYPESFLRVAYHVDGLTGWLFTWVELTGDKSQFIPRPSDMTLAWEETSPTINPNGEPSIWVEKWLVHDALTPYFATYGSMRYLTHKQAQQRIEELRSK